MEYEDFENDENAEEYLHFITTQEYSFAQSSVRIWGDNKKTRIEDEDSPDYETEDEYYDKQRRYKEDSGSMAQSEIYEVEHGLFWQITPNDEDDGFFEWYCWVREDYQIFKTKEMCVLYFIKYWTYWVRQEKPDWEGCNRFISI